MAVSEEFKGFKYAYEINLDWDNTATKLIRLVGRNKNVLEFGCGPGHMSKVLTEKMGCRVTGIEIDREAAKSAERYCEKVYSLDLDQADVFGVIKEKNFDVLLLADILEHLKDPEALLNDISGLAGRSGYVVASVPNVGYCGLVAELLAGQFQYRDLGILDRTHLRFFTRESFVALLETCGYEVQLVDSYKLPPEYSEFKDHISLLSARMRQLILKGREALAYQYIVMAKRAC